MFTLQCFDACTLAKRGISVGDCSSEHFSWISHATYTVLLLTWHCPINFYFVVNRHRLYFPCLLVGLSVICPIIYNSMMSHITLFEVLSLLK